MVAESSDKNEQLQYIFTGTLPGLPKCIPEAGMDFVAESELPYP